MRDRRVYGRRRYEAGAQLLAQLKNRPCQDCGRSFPPYVMDFDHRPGTTKKFNLASQKRRPLPMLIEEAAKCDVVCANCHRDRTWRRLHA